MKTILCEISFKDDPDDLTIRQLRQIAEMVIENTMAAICAGASADETEVFAHLSDSMMHGNEEYARIDWSVMDTLTERVARTVGEV